MTNNIREQISALLDNELSKDEIGQTFDRLSEQKQLRDTWDRYHLISDVIRGDIGERASLSLADRVRVQIDAEPAILAAPKPVKTAPAWVRPLAGTAVAASVAILAVMTAPQLLNPEAKAPSQIAATKVTTPIYAQSASLPSVQNYRLVNSAQYQVQPVTAARPAARWSTQYAGTRWKNLARPATENKLNKYLMDHSEYATQGAVSGVVPYATFVGYDARR